MRAFATLLFLIFSTTAVAQLRTVPPEARRGTVSHVQDMLIELNRDTGAALVVATHNERFATALGRCLRLEHGRLIEVHPDAPWEHRA